MDGEKLRINLLIDNERYPLRIPRAEEEVYRAAGKLIDQLLNKYRNLYPEDSEKFHWTLVALQLAYVNRRIEKRNDTQPYAEKITQWLAEIERSIEGTDGIADLPR